MGSPEEGNSHRLPFHKRTFTATFSFTKALLISILLFVAILWFFFLGLILGRGQYPEDAIPEVSKIMPRSNATDVALQVITVSPKEEVDKILEAEEKKQREKEIRDQSVEAIETPSTPTAPQERKVFSKVATKQGIKKGIPPKERDSSALAPTLAAIKQKVGKNTKESQMKQKTTAPSASVLTAPSQVYNYVYQVASFKDPEPANALIKKLVKSGIKARLSLAQGGNAMWNRVVVDFQGTPEQVENLRNQLLPHRLTKILMIKKEPVSKEKK